MKVNSDVANNKNKGIKIPVLSAFLLLVHLINLYVTPQIQKFISKENLPSSYRGPVIGKASQSITLV